MKDFSKNILGKIKKEKIKPIAKWSFVFKKSFVWSLFTLSVILGGLAFGSILAQITSTEWEIHPRVSDNLPYFVFITLPYLWIIFMIGFSALAFYYLRHTSKGYRYNTVIVINSSILISVLLGTSLYATGFSHRMEETFEDRIPFYNGMMNPRSRIWMMPEKGLLAGKILEIENEKEIKLEDFKNDIWIVDISEAKGNQISFLQENIRVKIIGEQDGKLLFIAEEIRPWGPLDPGMCDQLNPDRPCPNPPNFPGKIMKENFQPMRNSE